MSTTLTCTDPVTSGSAPVASSGSRADEEPRADRIRRASRPRLGVPRELALIAPVLVSGLATLLLFTSVDRRQPVTLVAGVLGVVLVGSVLVRQLGKVLELEHRVRREEVRLTTISEVISNVNAVPNLGARLGDSVQRMQHALQAEAACLWLPDPRSEGALVLVEQFGWKSTDHPTGLLEPIRTTRSEAETRASQHPLPIAGEPEPWICLSACLGSEDEHLGYLAFLRQKGAFSATDAALVGAVATDIGSGVRSVRMVTEARKLCDRDPVTGLNSHRAIYQRLHSELERHVGTRKPLSVLMMDLDNFRLYNEAYGHAAGDEVLRRTSALLRRTARAEDILGRYGGDEFLLLMPETTARAALRMAERIQAALGKERFRCRDSATLPITFCYGIATFPDDAPDVQQLVSAADSNLFRSRCQGGNQITVGRPQNQHGAVLHTRGLDLFQAMITAVDNKDGYTRQHSEEVTEYSLRIARGLSLDEVELKTIEISGMLHDVGKIGVPDEILRKPGRLTEEEFSVMAQHPLFGAVLVGSLPGMEEVVLGVRHHHERWDGNGYPDRLAGFEIPRIARIMAIADAYSAMTTSRPYRKGLSEKQAQAEIERGLGTQFDPELGRLFLRLGAEGTEVVPVARRRRVGVSATLDEQE